MLTRAFVAGSVAFKVSCRTPVIRDAVECLFTDLAEPPSGQPFEILSPLGLSENNTPVDLLTDRALDGLVGLVNTRSRQASAQVAIHAAAMEVEGAGVLIPAKSGTGKSVLAAALARSGAGYLSDECAFLLDDGRTLGGFGKPITIKQSGVSLVPGAVAARVTIDGGARSHCQCPASLLGATVVPSAPAGLIVFLERCKGAASLEPVEPADAVVELLQHVLNADVVGPGLLTAIASVLSDYFV